MRKLWVSGQSIFDDAIFQGAAEAPEKLNMKEMVVEMASFKKARFENVDLAGSQFHGVCFDGAVFDKDTELTNLKFVSEVVDHQIEAARIKTLLDKNRPLAQAQAQGLAAGTMACVTTFKGCDLSGKSFAGSDISGCSFAEADLSGADFSEALVDGFRVKDLLGKPLAILSPAEKKAFTQLTLILTDAHYSVANPPIFRQAFFGKPNTLLFDYLERYNRAVELIKPSEKKKGKGENHEH